MAVAILPYGRPDRHHCDLGGIPLAEAEWPLEDRPAGEALCDLGSMDHLVLFASSKSFSASHKGLKCRVSLLLMEPPIIQRRYYLMLRFFSGSFHRILTHNTSVLMHAANARFLAHGGSLLNSIPSGPLDKSRRMSLIASQKRATPGQRLRHEIADWSRREQVDLHLCGYGYQPLQDKSLGHLPYMYSVVIENSRTPGYFTEKLIDSFLCASIPIYWGAPDVEHFFDPRGMIICRSHAEVMAAVRSVDGDQFLRQKPFLEENRRRALQYLDCRTRAAELLREEDRMRN